MSHLAPHPWDKFGEPPRPGPAYPQPGDWQCQDDHGDACRSAADCAATIEDELVEMAHALDDAERRARSKQDEADEAQGHADSLADMMSEMRKRIADLKDLDPAVH